MFTDRASRPGVEETYRKRVLEDGWRVVDKEMCCSQPRGSDRGRAGAALERGVAPRWYQLHGQSRGYDCPNAALTFGVARYQSVMPAMAIVMT